MARPKKGNDDDVSTSFRLPRELMDELDRVAQERLVSRSLIVERAIKEFLARLEPWGAR